MSFLSDFKVALLGTAMIVLFSMFASPLTTKQDQSIIEKLRYRSRQVLVFWISRCGFFVILS